MVGYSPVKIGLRYLLRKKLSYLAVVGIALSVGVIIVVMSVFTGFHREFTAVIRGYLSDMKIRPQVAGMYAMEDWQLWRERALAADENVRGAAPFIEGAALLRRADSGRMLHVMFRGVEPDLEGTASELPDYLVSGTMADLTRTYRNPEGGRLRACFVGKGFLPYIPPALQANPLELVLVTATEDLRRSLAKYAVNGVFQTGNSEYDSQFVILSLDAAADFVDSGGAVSGLNLRLADYDNAEQVRGQLREAFAPGAVLYEAPEQASTIALSGDGSRLATVADGAVVVRRTRDGEELLKIPPQNLPPTAVALSADGRHLLVAGPKGPPTLWDTVEERRTELTASSENASLVTAACLSPYAYFAAVGREDGTLELWETDTGEPMDLPRTHEGPVLNLAFDADGKLMVSAGDDGQALVWDVEDGSVLARLGDSAGEAVTAAAFSPDGRNIATGAADGRVVLWDSRTARPLTALETHAGPVRALGFGWTSNVLLSAAADGVRCLGIRQEGNRAVAWERFALDVPAGGAAAAAFSGDGRRMLTLSEDGAARLLYTGPFFSVTTWEEERKTFLEAVQMERFLQALIMSLILVLAEFFVFVILTTMVYEKRRDIGILKATGFTSGQVGRAFVVVGLAIGLAGAVLGVAGGVLLADNINAVRGFVHHVTGWDPFPPDVYYFTEIPSYVGWVTPAITAGGAVLCSLLFSLIPALRAARMDPVRTLHYE
ncbi:MAG: FtsX-like permease family protein [Candidatus Brocadiia bacterium]